jgi:hypothetical protein
VAKIFRRIQRSDVSMVGVLEIPGGVAILPGVTFPFDYYEKMTSTFLRLTLLVGSNLSVARNVTLYGVTIVD